MASIQSRDDARAVPAPPSSAAQSVLTPRRLTTSELGAARGGYVATTYITPAPNSTSDEDNILFTTGYQSYLNENAYFAMFSGSTKISPAVVASANQSGALWARTNFPPWGAYYNMTTRFFAPNSYGYWIDSASAGNHRVNPAIRMIQLRMWNSTFAGVTSNASLSQLAPIVDLLNYPTGYSFNVTDSVDAIAGQCGSPSQKMQFRLYQGAAPSLLNLQGACPNYPLPFWPSTSCSQDAYNRTTNSGTDNFYLNIVVLPPGGIAGGTGAFHIRDPGTNPTWYWIAIEEDLLGIGANALATLLSHELAHWLAYPNSGAHYEDLNGAASCPGTSAYNNLMCTQLAAGGRQLTGTQCTGIGNTQPFYYYDTN